MQNASSRSRLLPEITWYPIIFIQPSPSLPAFAAVLCYTQLLSIVLEIFHCPPMASLHWYPPFCLSPELPILPRGSPVQQELGERVVRSLFLLQGGHLELAVPLRGRAQRLLFFTWLFLSSLAQSPCPFVSLQMVSLAPVGHSPVCSALSDESWLSRACLCITMQGLGLLGRAFKPRCFFPARLC